MLSSCTLEITNRLHRDVFPPKAIPKLFHKNFHIPFVFPEGLENSFILSNDDSSGNGPSSTNNSAILTFGICGKHHSKKD